MEDRPRGMKESYDRKAALVTEGTESKGQKGVERWAMPRWCHMFNSTLIGAARVWFDELPPESIDGYKGLKSAFLAYFMQQKKYVKDPVEIHNIKQRDGETIEDFMERFKVETGRMKGAPECMRISGFMHGVNNPELTKRLNEHVPKTMEEMMTITTAFIRGEAAAASKKKGHLSWKSQDHSKRQATERKSDFRSQPREGRGSITKSSAMSETLPTLRLHRLAPRQPVAPPSPDFILGPENPQTPPVPQEEDDPTTIRVVLPAEEQPLPPVDSPTAESPGCVTESDPEEDPDGYEDDETEDGPVDYPMDGGDDGDDDDGDSSRDDARDEDEDEEDEEDEEEEEHLASADSTTVIPADEPVFLPKGTEPVIPPPSTDITIGARITVRPQTSISLPPEAEVERLLTMTTPSPSPPISLSPPSAGERLARCTAPPAHSPPLPPSSGCLTQIQTLRIASTQARLDALYYLSITTTLHYPPLYPCHHLLPLKGYIPSLSILPQEVVFVPKGSRYESREFPLLDLDQRQDKIMGLSQVMRKRGDWE
ncbi:reverse transcriptase domain-containing protein [Tanacetum coccineum]